MQMIERPWGVTAHGVASVKARPDLVRIRFQVIRVEATPPKVFAAATEAVGRIRTTLRRHGVEDRAVERSQLDLQSAWEGYGEHRKFVGYRCTASFAVEVTALDAVQPLLVDLVAAGANEIEGVIFDVTTKGELRAQARREAVAAARRKAELYADAAGIRLGAVVHVEDVDPERAGFERYRGHGSGGDAAGDDLAPGHVVVSAAVTVGWSISH